MKKLILILAVMFVAAFSCSAEVDLETKLNQNIEHAEEMVQYYEEMRQYNIDYYKWQVECRKIDEKYYEETTKYYKAYAKKLKKIKKMNEAKDAKDNAPTKEKRLYANDRYKSLSKQIAKIKLPKYPKKEYPEAPKRPEYPKQEY